MTIFQRKGCTERCSRVDNEKLPSHKWSMNGFNDLKTTNRKIKALTRGTGLAFNFEKPSCVPASSEISESFNKKNE